MQGLSERASSAKSTLNCCPATWMIARLLVFRQLSSMRSYNERNRASSCAQMTADTSSVNFLSSASTKYQRGYSCLIPC
ncbi:Barttin [Frankliniella fusca]|uniref:Barttin n=1 Tax=Frankliniella fusca TaxID=407009 RepID=A0AAE1HQF5_9NEOP|nr:Barttin [Frankliniella fusca]